MNPMPEDPEIFEQKTNTRNTKTRLKTTARTERNALSAWADMSWFWVNSRSRSTLAAPDIDSMPGATKLWSCAVVVVHSLCASRNGVAQQQQQCSKQVAQVVVQNHPACGEETPRAEVSLGVTEWCAAAPVSQVYKQYIVQHQLIWLMFLSQRGLCLAHLA